MLRLIRVSAMGCTLAGAAASTVASHDDPPVGSVGWVEQQLEQARQFGPHTNIHMCWREETYRLMTDSELEAARQSIAGKPDHPDRFKVAAEEKRIARGADVVEYELWYGGPERWRFNQTELSAEGQHVDMALAGTESWQMSPEQIQYLRSDSAPPGFEPSTRQGLFVADVRQCVLGALSLGGQSEKKVVYAETSPDGRWRGRVRRGDGGFEWDCSGRFEGDQLSITERRAFQLNRGNREQYGKVGYSGQEFNSFLQERVFTRMDVELRDGTRSSSLALVLIDPLEQGELREVLRRPVLGGADVVRGAVAASQAVDHRDSGPKVIDKLEDGSLRSTVWGADSPGLGQSSPELWRVVGWLSGAVVVLGGVVLWRRRAGVGWGDRH